MEMRQWPFSFPKLVTDYGQNCGESYVDVSQRLGQRLAQLTKATNHILPSKKSSTFIQNPASTTSQSSAQSSEQPPTSSAPVVSEVPSKSASTSHNSRIFEKRENCKLSGHVSQLEKGSSSTKLFVLVCVPRRRQLQPGIISILDSATDEEFFAAFRKKYRSLRGFWRYWLHPRQFSFCHATKFEKFDIGSLGKVYNEMPEDESYIYVPKPAPRPYIAPMTVEEWEKRFSGCVKARGLNDAFQRMPKRNCRFQLSTHFSREYMWGLHAHCRISAIMVLLWQFFITSGGWCFAAWWLKDHPGDLQNAAVPVTLIIGAVMLLWLPLNEKFKDYDEK
jgi:hypothetical protein